MTICCPRGEWMPRKHRCKVGTRATGLDKPSGMHGLPPIVRGARKEGREHPWASPAMARKIARDHLKENPRAYGGIKPAFKVGQRIHLTRAGFPGMTVTTPATIVEVRKAGKRAGYDHRYEIEAPDGRRLWASEPDMELIP